MGEEKKEFFKHLVLVKFKDDVVFDAIIKGMETLVNELTLVDSFIWGKDVESHEMLRQGFSHVFLMTFKNKEDFVSFASHPKHVEFSKTFSAAIEKAVLLDFPACAVKSPPENAPSPTEKDAHDVPNGKDPVPLENDPIISENGAISTEK